MSRPKLIAAAVAAGLLVAVTAAGAYVVPKARSPKRPNILFIVTDDQDLRSLALMPRVSEELAAGGMTFNRHYVTSALCCPSRASILRSQYVHSHEVKGNSKFNGAFQKFAASELDRSTIASWLRGAGYRSGLIGKYLNGYPRSKPMTYVPPDWDYWASPVLERAYDGFNYSINENGVLHSYGHAPHEYATDVFARKAAAFIEGALGDRVPFFLYLAPFVPHAPAIPAPRSLGSFARKKAPRDGSFNQADISLMPNFVKRLSLLSNGDQMRIDSQYRRRAETLMGVDEMVESLIQLLRARGALDSTYIVYTSDNGFHLGQHRLRPGKRTSYEEDIHVPLVIRGPGIEPQSSTDAITSALDFGPTFAAWARASVPDFVEGRSLAPLISAGGRKPSGWRNAVVVEHYLDSSEKFENNAGAANDDVPAAGNARVPPYYALRSESKLFVRYADGERELYDTDKDPYQMKNLAASAPQEQIAGLDRWLQEIIDCEGESCLDAERSPPSL